MEIRSDFLEWLGPDASTNVLMLLDDPADIVRLSAVSRSWRRYVISNGFCKKLCLRRCGGVSCFTHVIVETNTNNTMEEAGSSSDSEWVNLVKEHMVYSYLGRCLLKPLDDDDELIHEAIRASSTDNDQCIETTLLQGDRVDMQPSFWSSKGESDSGVPETPIYRLGARFCLVNEIKVQPFEAYYQPGNPIYSATSVRFRMGHSLLDPDENVPYTSSFEKPGTNALLYDSDGEFVWTYVTPEFPMAQRNELQIFRLPSPVLCIGGFVQVEMMGRVQVQAADNLYYMCICNVQVIGRPISPAFNIDIDVDSGGSVLKYFPDKQSLYESWPNSIYKALQHRVRFIQRDIMLARFFQDDEMLLMAMHHMNHVISSDDEEDDEFIGADIGGI